MAVFDCVGITLSHVMNEFAPTCNYCHRRLDKGMVTFSQKSSWKERKVYIDLLCKCGQFGEIELNFPTLGLAELQGSFNLSPKPQVTPLEYNSILKSAISITQAPAD